MMVKQVRYASTDSDQSEECLTWVRGSVSSSRCGFNTCLWYSGAGLQDSASLPAGFQKFLLQLKKLRQAGQLEINTDTFRPDSSTIHIIKHKPAGSQMLLINGRKSGPKNTVVFWAEVIFFVLKYNPVSSFFSTHIAVQQLRFLHAAVCQLVLWVEEPSIEAVPRHQSSAEQRAAASVVSTHQVAQSSNVEGPQLHRPARKQRQLQTWSVITFYISISAQPNDNTCFLSLQKEDYKTSQRASQR